jgi:hypothetical protein
VVATCTGLLIGLASSRRCRHEKLSAIRVVNEPDVVTQVPKAPFLQNVYYMLGAVLNLYWPVSAAVNWAERLTYKLKLPSAYKHVGSEITMDSRQVDYIQKMKGGEAGQFSALFVVVGDLYYTATWMIFRRWKEGGGTPERFFCSKLSIVTFLEIQTTNPRE